MRKFFKTSTLLVLAMVMLFSSAMPCMAANLREDITRSSSNIVYVGTGSNKLEYSTTYKTIAYVDPSNSTGFGAEIIIIVAENTEASFNDIRMLDRYGNPVWEGIGAISRDGSRSFECGSNVYTVQIRTQSGRAHAYSGFVRTL